ncbi:MAG TPA: UTP--glucose-1-phosphate uridylyltransferase [Thermoplasmata archaeon]|nr:UTP--glucose-1-phosphate uridylyltransferase [Thermoplasmata archaeon]
MKVVIPAAGLGARFLPATKSMPKEMLPVLDRPIIQYVVEEAVESGADDILIVTGRSKRAVEDHFDYSPDHGDHHALGRLDGLSDKANIFYVRQRRPKGLGDAVLCAARHVGRDPFGVLLGDTINVCDVPLLKQLFDKFWALGGKSSVIAVDVVPDSKVSDYGIVAGEEISPGVIDVHALVEKPTLADAPSRYGITGAYVFTPTVFECLRKTPPGRNGEVQLTDALVRLLEHEHLYAVTFEGTRYDIGDRFLWLKANIEFALREPMYAEKLRAFLEVQLGQPPIRPPTARGPVPPEPSG